MLTQDRASVKRPARWGLAGAQERGASRPWRAGPCKGAKAAGRRAPPSGGGETVVKYLLASLDTVLPLQGDGTSPTREGPQGEASLQAKVQPTSRR